LEVEASTFPKPVVFKNQDLNLPLGDEPFRIERLVRSRQLSHDQ